MKPYTQDHRQTITQAVGSCYAIPSFGLRDNSIHLHECSPFLVRYFHYFKKKTIMIESV